MALFQTPEARGVITTPGPLTSGIVVEMDAEFTIPAGLVAGDVVEMLRLPAYCTIVDAILVSDDLDTNATPTIALDVGFVSGVVGQRNHARTCDNVFFSGDTVGRAGGVSRMTRAGGFRVAKVEEERAIGIRIATAAATLAVGAKVRLIVMIKQ